MNRQSLGAIVVPVLLITVGVGWLLTNQGVRPEINWIWTLGLAAVGLLSLLGGLDKVSVVVGPFMLLASVFSVLRQSGKISVDIEVPLLVIAAGVLLLVARLPIIPIPAWVVENSKNRSSPRT